MLGEDVLGGLVGVLDHPADLVVDLAGDLVRVVGLGGELTAEEGHGTVVAEDARTEALGHAEAHHHLLRGLGHLLQVVRGAGGDLTEDDLLGGPASQRHRHRVVELRAGGEELVLRRQGDRVAERLAAADDRNLVDRVGVGQQVPDDRVPELVVGGDQSLLLRHHPALLLRAGDHAHDPFLELGHRDLALARAGREQRRLVDQVGEVCSREAGRLARERVEIDVLGERLAARMDLEDLLAALAVGSVDDDLAIEAARPEQRRVEDVGAVGGGDQDDVVLHLEAVHLDEQLVEGLLPLVVTAAHAGAAVAADGVDLVHEDDAGGVLLGLLEEVADARGAHADEHLDEVGAGDREERHPRLTRDGAGEQRLTGPGRSVEQHALRDAGAQRLELLRVLQELLDLVELLHGLVRSGDVAEGDLRRVDRHPLGAGLTEAHHPAAASLHLVHQEDPEGEKQQEGQDVREQREEAGAALALDLGLDVVLLEGVEQLGLGCVGVGIRLVVARAVVLLDVEAVVLRVPGDRLDLVAVDPLDEGVVVGRLVARARTDQALGEKRQHDDDQDGKGSAAEETSHGGVLSARGLRPIRGPGSNARVPAFI